MLNLIKGVISSYDLNSNQAVKFDKYIFPDAQKMEYDAGGKQLLVYFNSKLYSLSTDGKYITLLFEGISMNDFVYSSQVISQYSAHVLKYVPSSV